MDEAIWNVEKQIETVSSQISQLMVIAGLDGSALNDFQKETLRVLRKEEEYLRKEKEYLRKKKLRLLEKSIAPSTGTGKSFTLYPLPSYVFSLKLCLIRAPNAIDER